MMKQKVYTCTCVHAYSMSPMYKIGSKTTKKKTEIMYLKHLLFNTLPLKYLKAIYVTPQNSLLTSKVPIEYNFPMSVSIRLQSINSFALTKM